MSDVTRGWAAGAVGAAAGLAALLGVAAAGGADAVPRPAAVEQLDARTAVGTAGTGDDVLPGVTAGAPVPSARTLDGLLRPLLTVPALGGSVSMEVVDVLSGEQLAELGAGTPRVPASTAKILTAVAALTALDPQATLATTVVPGAAGEVVLVGAGDVLLAPDRGDPARVNGHAGLGDLARSAAAALRRQGRTSVSVRLDDTLFVGPAQAPSWSPGDIQAGFVAPVQALAVDAGRTRAGRYAPRTGDPAMAAAQRFAGLLQRAGIVVNGPVRRGTAPAGAEPLAQVRSAGVGDLVEYALTESDNTVAEVLGRLVALETGHPGSFTGAGNAVIAAVEQAGVPVTGTRLADASGLGDGSLIAASTLTGALVAAADPEHPELRQVLTGLPVAAVSGTLADRFDRPGQRSATGVVRAKTGTLQGVSSLAGTVVDADGRLLAFAVLADGVRSTDPARRALDTLVTTLASCGCR